MKHFPFFATYKRKAGYLFCESLPFLAVGCYRKQAKQIGYPRFAHGHLHLHVFDLRV